MCEAGKLLIFVVSYTSVNRKVFLQDIAADTESSLSLLLLP